MPAEKKSQKTLKQSAIPAVSLFMTTETKKTIETIWADKPLKGMRLYSIAFISEDGDALGWPIRVWGTWTYAKQVALLHAGSDVDAMFVTDKLDFDQ